LKEVCQSLAYQIAADGEGATKVVSITVRGATDEAAAKAMARSIANSPLVKCAMHGNDPNWGRIVSAAGLCGVPFDADKSQLTLQGTAVFRRGRPLAIDAAALSKADWAHRPRRCGRAICRGNISRLMRIIIRKRLLVRFEA
jgi:glutamate N-acetyltransferase/amino-acid N-acetyltransferase